MERSGFPLTKNVIASNIMLSRGIPCNEKKISFVGTWAFTPDGTVINWAMGVHFPIILCYKSQDYSKYVKMYNSTDALREEDFEDFAELNKIMIQKYS